MIQNTLHKSLAQIGLDDNQIKVYLLLLENNNFNVTDISRETGIGRNKIYDILKELAQLELIDHTKDFGRKILLKSPSIIGTLLKNQKYQVNHTINDFETILPNLITNYFETKVEPEIKIYEGVNKFVYLMNLILSESQDGEELLSFNESQDLWNIMDYKYFESVWINGRVRKNIFAKILLRNDLSQREFLLHEITLDSTKFRQMKILKNPAVVSGCYWIIGNKVIHWDTLNAKAVLISNSTITDNMRLNFELVWNQT